MNEPHYRYTEPLTVPKLITIQGQARGGKGSLSRALEASLETEFRVYMIEQGLKFRVLAKMALERGLDYESEAEIVNFLANPARQTEVIERLQAAQQMPDDEFKATYYEHQVSNVSGMFGKVSATHDVVVDLLLKEVRAAVGTADIIMIDGRAMQKYGDMLDEEGVVDHVLAIDVVCEPLTAARRVTQIFAPAEELSNEDLIKLIYTTEDISRRNSSDARRKRDPSVFLHEAFELDVLRPVESDEQFDKMCAKAAEVGVLSIDNSFTRTLEQFTEPSVRLIRCVIERAL